jgi:hypothetical protein
MYVHKISPLLICPILYKCIEKENHGIAWIPIFEELREGKFDIFYCHLVYLLTFVNLFSGEL